MKIENNLENILISIIVPVYNTEEYLNQCIESIVNQTYKNLEIIFIDDGSTDSSPFILSEWKNKDKRITVFRQDNSGVSASRNKGIDESHGDYICFIDSDDEIDPLYCEKLLNLCIKNQSEVAVGAYDRIDDLFNKKYIPKHNAVSSDKVLYLLTNGSMPVVVWNRIYQSTILKKHKFVEGMIYEDGLFSTEILSKIKKCSFCKDIVYHYRYRKGSLSKTILDKHLKDKISTQKMRLLYIEKLYDENNVIVLQQKIQNWWLAQTYLLSNETNFSSTIVVSTKAIQSERRKDILKNILHNPINLFLISFKYNLILIMMTFIPKKCLKVLRTWAKIKYFNIRH